MKQNMVSRYSAEVEYRAITTITGEVIWISGIVHDMGVKLFGLTTLYCDNKADINMVANPMYYERTKYI